MSAIDFTSVVSSHDVRVVQLADRFHLAVKARDRLWPMHRIGRQRLDRDQSFQTSVQGFVNHPHAARAKLLL